MDIPTRQTAVAGRFYPSDPEILCRDVEGYLSVGRTSQKIIGCLVPHAGYIYSGGVAGAVYSAIEVPKCCLVLCPNHTGKGKALAIMSRGAWETPLGPVAIDAELADALRAQYPLLTEDFEAHRGEHSIEVQLPFMLLKNPAVTFVPIALGTRQFEILEQLGVAVGEVLKRQTKPVLIIASSDMNHYESDPITREKDHKAIEQILALDPAGLFEVVIREQISMCGFGPTVVMLTAAKRLGAKSAELIKYVTSGDVSGDRSMVVGYAGIVVC